MNNHEPIDPLLLVDAQTIIRQLAELKTNLELELIQRNAVIDQLYSRVKELEAKLYDNEPEEPSQTKE